MKRKITSRFLIYIFISTILIFVLSLASIYYFAIRGSQGEVNSPESILWQFDQYISIEDNQVQIDQIGRDILARENLWLQVLDKNGNEVYQIDKPENTPDHYSPAQIVHYHLHSKDLNDSTILLTNKDLSDYTYMIGFPKDRVSKIIIDIEASSTEFVIQSILIMLLIAILVFTIMSFIFGTKFTNPIVRIINGVERLSKGKYDREYEEDGIYSNVFKSLNKLTDNLKTSQDERLKTENMREEWISNISHDLKTPLSSIKGYAEIISNHYNDTSKEDIVNYSNIIMHKTDYMDEMIEELRLNEKLKNNSLNIKRREGNLTEFLRETIIEILNHPDYQDRTINFEPKEEKIIYNFDKNLMKRSISNLIYNSLVHNSEDTIIKVDIDQKEYIDIFIEDNGSGISDKDLDKLFNRYYRGTSTSGHKGSGLGMSIAKEVIEAHGGSIEVKSKLGMGTKIQIRF